MPRLAISTMLFGLLTAPALPALAADAGVFYLLASARYAEFAGDVRVSSEGVYTSEFAVDSKLPAAKIGFGYQAHPKFALEFTLAHVTGGDVEPPNKIGSGPGRMSSDGHWIDPADPPPNSPGFGSLDDLTLMLFEDVMFEDGSLVAKDLATILAGAIDFPANDPTVNHGICNRPLPSVTVQRPTVEEPTSIDWERDVTCSAGLDVFDFETVDLAVSALWSPFSDSGSRFKPFLGFGLLHRWSKLTARYTIRSTAVTTTYTFEHEVMNDMVNLARTGIGIEGTEENDPLSQPMSRTLSRTFKETSFYGTATLGFEYRASRVFSWVPSLNYSLALDRDDANFWDAEIAMKYAF